MMPRVTVKIENKTADPNLFFLKNMSAFIAYVNSKQVLPMILLLAGGYIFTLLPSILGIVALFMLYALVYKLAVDVLIETANGNMLPGDYQSSFEAKDILLKFILVGLLQTGFLFWLRFFVLDPLIIIVYIVVSTFITPAIFMVLSVTNSIFSALNPVTIIRLIKPWFVSYLTFVGFWLVLEFAQTYGLEPLATKIPGIFGEILAQFFKFFFLILSFHIMGFLIYQNRKLIGFETRFDAEDSDKINFEPPDINPIHERIRFLLKTGDLVQAQAMIADLKQEGGDSKDLKALELLAFDISKGKDIKPLSDSEKIHELVSQNKIGEAFKVYYQLILDKKTYIEKEPTDISALVKYAYASEKYQLVISLLKFFHNKYPKHEDIVANYFLIVQILYKSDKTRDQATSMLKNLIKKFPEHKMTPQLISWLQGIELMKL